MNNDLRFISLSVYVFYPKPKNFLSETVEFSQIGLRIGSELWEEIEGGKPRRKSDWFGDMGRNRGG